MPLGTVVSMGEREMKQELLEVEQRGWSSLCDGTGDVVYGELMTEDAVMVLANGEIMDRQTVVQALGQAPPWRTYGISDVRLSTPDPIARRWSTAAARTARARSQRPLTS